MKAVSKAVYPDFHCFISLCLMEKAGRGEELDVMSPVKCRGVDLFQGGEATSNCFLCRPDDPVERFPFRRGAAAEPHTVRTCAHSQWNSDKSQAADFFWKVFFPDDSQPVLNFL